jgi:hypothetical protein
MPPTIARLLETWRAAQRRLDALEPGHPDRATAAAEVERASAEYQALSHVVTDALMRETTIMDPWPIDPLAGRSRGR